MGVAYFTILLYICEVNYLNKGVKTIFFLPFEVLRATLGVSRMAWGKLKQREFFTLFCLQHSVINCNQKILFTISCFLYLHGSYYFSYKISFMK